MFLALFLMKRNSNLKLTGIDVIQHTFCTQSCLLYVLRIYVQKNVTNQPRTQLDHFDVSQPPRTVLALDLEGVHDVKLHHPSSSVATSNQ